LAALLTLNCANFPAECTAGLTFQASAAFAAYPAPEWTLTAHLRGPGQIDLQADAAGVFSATAATTATWAAGTYWYSMRATSGADVLEVATGQLVVKPDLAAAAAGFDGRSQNERALDAINAVLEKRASQDQQRYVIKDRELWRTPIADLLKLKTHYQAAVRRERNAAAGRTGFGRTIKVNFQ
jgi:hypothetical protein